MQNSSGARHGASNGSAHTVLTCFLVLQSKAGAQVKDLMNRLNNAVKQRNAAREEALLASEKLKVRCSCWRMLPQRSDQNSGQDAPFLQ